MSSDHRYIGGPLSGQRAEMTGEYWDCFRDSRGRRVDDQVGYAALYHEPAEEREHYYLVGVDGHGMNYVHTTLMETMLAAWTWENEVHVAFSEDGDG